MFKISFLPKYSCTIQHSHRLGHAIYETFNMSRPGGSRSGASLLETNQNLVHKKKKPPSRSLTLSLARQKKKSRFIEHEPITRAFEVPLPVEIGRSLLSGSHCDEDLGEKEVCRCPICQFPFKYLTGQSTRWHVSECDELKEKDVNGDCPYGLKCDSYSVQHYRKYYHILQATAGSGGKLTEQHLEKGKSKHEESKEYDTLRYTHSPSLTTLPGGSSQLSQQNPLTNLQSEASQRRDSNISKCQNTNVFGNNFKTDSVSVEVTGKCSTKNENSPSSRISSDCTDNILKDNLFENGYEEICDEIVAELEINPDFESYSETDQIETIIPVHQSNANDEGLTTVVKKFKLDPTLSVSFKDEKINNDTSSISSRTQSEHTFSRPQSHVSSCHKSSANKSLVQKDVGIYFGLKPITKPKAISTGGHLKPSEWGPWGSSGGKKKRSYSNSTQFGATTANGDERSGVVSNKRQCPFYKKIPDTAFTVDAFNYGNISGCSAYFLSHFHYDHYQGLTKHFKNKIYCTRITSNLVISKLRIPSQYVHVLPMHQSVCVEGVNVHLLEANHCPGSVMFLFELSNGKTILHTGDFRATKDMVNFPELLNKQIDVLYLDTTYCLPYYNFPTQNDTIQFAVSVVEKAIVTHPRTLIVCGSYTIGKERVFVAIAKALDCKICVRTDKKRILNCLEWDEVDSRLTAKWNEAQIHVLPMKSLSIKGMEDHLRLHGDHFTHILAFKPTGWTYTAKMEKLEDIKPVRRGPITIYGIPYSEHSSYSELEWFVQYTQPKKIIPTVNMGSPTKRNEMQKTFTRWLTETQGKQTKLK